MLRLVECGVMLTNCDDTSRAVAGGNPSPSIFRPFSRADEGVHGTKLQAIVTAALFVCGG